MPIKKYLRCLIVPGIAAFSIPVAANIWVFEPSLTLDQRFDDNYYLIPAGDGSLSATRAVGELGLSRESQSASYTGLVRVDALLTTTDENGNEGLESNQIAVLEAKRRLARSRYGMKLTFKQDTPSRDIAADLSDSNSLATDTGLNVTQSSNVARQEVTLTPSFQYDLTRRLVFDSKAAFTLVNHELPDAQDAIYRFYIDTFPRNADGSFDGTPLSYSEVTIADVGNAFSPSGELDDFQEGEFELGLRYKLSLVSTVSATAAYSNFNAEVEPDSAAIIPFEDLIPDSEATGIRRKARRESISTTAKFKLGYERSLSPTLKLGVAGGVYFNTTDKSDTLRRDDEDFNQDAIVDYQSTVPVDQQIDNYFNALESETNGWLSEISLIRDADVTRYVGKLSIDVEPSSSGGQVESLELTGDVFHILSPRLNVNLRARAFEPDRLGAKRNDRFARRFISFEPKISWKYARNWTLAAAYRYRRQKARIDPVSAESNAILLSITFTPPSEIRDAQNAKGL